MTKEELAEEWVKENNYPLWIFWRRRNDIWRRIEKSGDGCSQQQEI